MIDKLVLGGTGTGDLSILSPDARSSNVYSLWRWTDNVSTGYHSCFWIVPLTLARRSGGGARFDFGALALVEASFWLGTKYIKWLVSYSPGGEDFCFPNGEIYISNSSDLLNETVVVLCIITYSSSGTVVEWLRCWLLLYYVSEPNKTWFEFRFEHHLAIWLNRLSQVLLDSRLC